MSDPKPKLLIVEDDTGLQAQLKWAYPDFEVIIVNDGSKDATFAVARQFESSQVSVATRPNRGASATRNERSSVKRVDRSSRTPARARWTRH